MSDEKLHTPQLLLFSVIGFLINGIGLPLLIGTLKNVPREDLKGMVITFGILTLIIWTVVFFIARRMEKRRGYKSALIFQGASVIVITLMIQGCLGGIG